MTNTETTPVTDQLREAAAKWPNRAFLDFNGATYTFADVWSLATSLAAGLRKVGVQASDTVVTMLDNNQDSVACWFATNLLGAIWVPINTALRGTFLQHVVTDSKAKVVLCEADFVDRFHGLVSVGDAELLLVRGVDDPVGTSVAIATDALDAYRHTSSEGGWMEASADDVSMLIYTGGTTGPSKGCIISHGYVMNLCTHYVRCTGRVAEEVNWSPLPVYHFNVLAQTIASSLLLGGVAAIAPKFSVSRFWPEIQRTRAQIVNLLGSMGTLIANASDTPEAAACRGQIRFVHGSPFPPDLQEVWRSRFGVRHVGAGVYGLTEAVPLTTLPYGLPSPPRSSGRRNTEDFDVRIFDDADRELPPGKVGEIVARPKRTNVMFQGYWGRPDATLATLRNLWFHTGDLGTFDDDGYFYFIDRKKDYLRRRGENISSVELESTYLAHPDIFQVAVHAVPSELTEDDVKATAVLKPESTLTPRALFEWSRDRIPYFALPRYIEFREALPTSALGRVHKYQLREEGVTPATWDRESDDVTWERR